MKDFKKTKKFSGKRKRKEKDGDEQREEAEDESIAKKLKGGCHD
jgi:hypothetical protein